LNKEYGTTIIVSASTVALLSARPTLRPLGAVVVKGKSVAVEIFEVLTGPAASVIEAAETAPEGR